MTQQWARILFDLDPSDWHGTAGETMWAVPIVGSEWRHFRLMISPFNARGVSYEDIVRATPIEHSEVFHFEEVVERGGHSTYMLIMKVDDRQVSAYWNLLEKIGCTYEGTHTYWDGKQRPLFSVDVPPSTDLYEVYEILERARKTRCGSFKRDMRTFQRHKGTWNSGTAARQPRHRRAPSAATSGSLQTNDVGRRKTALRGNR